MADNEIDEGLEFPRTPESEEWAASVIKVYSAGDESVGIQITGVVELQVPLDALSGAVSPESLGKSVAGLVHERLELDYAELAPYLGEYLTQATQGNFKDAAPAEREKVAADAADLVKRLRSGEDGLELAAADLIEGLAPKPKDG